MNVMPTNSQLELWAGVECTVNRVGNGYSDQLELNGHAHRPEDLELFAALGITAIRYPIIWERTAPEGLDIVDWSWSDERLNRLRQLNVRPIVGLVHHGSGPRDTSLVDPRFPIKLAMYARAVAARYPWVEDYTPINEPLTTARFSGLYGYWYPHGRDEVTFIRALLSQCRATVLSMRAIREINPRARLIQTEDLGKTYSTRSLAYQSSFENERRWLSYDLLCGRVNRDHPMWDYLLWEGIDEREVAWCSENPLGPSVLGINHYLTSERFLDERLERYPISSHGGNGRHHYADVEAVRVCAEGLAGPRALMKEAWARYRLPVAVTEAHLGCTREEQLRWFKEVWEGAKSLRSEGADIRAVTAWSLLGAYNWNNLLTRDEGHYEPGVFDLRGPRPRPTALARLLQDLSEGRDHDHPVLSAPGWWRRFDRLLYPPVARRRRDVVATVKGVNIKGQSTRPLLITGATGTLGKAFARLCEERGLAYRLLTRQQLDISDPEVVERALQQYEPWAIVNAAGYVRVDQAEAEPETCFRENTLGVKVLAEACARHKINLATFSSDLVFDGTKPSPYLESDKPLPLNVYGRSKAEAEREALHACPEVLVIRTSAFFGPWDNYNFITNALVAIARGKGFQAIDDAIVSPTYIPDLVHATLDLVIDREHGLWHLANPGSITWADLAREAARLAGLDSREVEGCATQSFNLPARRPAYSVLSSERGNLLPSLEDALVRYVAECQIQWSHSEKEPGATGSVRKPRILRAAAGAK